VGIAQGASREEIAGFWRWGGGSVLEVDEGVAPPAVTAFHACSPNPFRTSTVLRFALAPEKGAAERVRIEAFDVSGRRVASLLDAALPAGLHAIAWDGRDHSGRALPFGSYFLRFRAGSITTIRRAVIGS